MLKTIVFLLCLFFTSFAVSGEYYVDSRSGNDSADGTSPERAWKSIRRVNQAELKGGDTVLFRRGGFWRGTTLLPKSGTPGNPVCYDAYGEGEKPVLLSSTARNNPKNWRSCGKNLWETVSVEPSRGKAVAVDWISSWSVYREEPASARLTSTISDGTGAVRLEIDKPGDRPSRIQVIGPVIPKEGLQAPALLTVRVRCTKPFSIPTIAARRPDSPWTNYLEANSIDVTADWKEIVVLLSCRGADRDGRLVLYLGQAVPEDSVFEFQPLSLHEAAFPDAYEPLVLDVGNIVFDHGKAVGFKRWSLDELKEPLDFWHDYEGRRVVLLSEQNPAEVYGEIELCLKRHVVLHSSVRDCVIRNLSLRYGGGHGICGQDPRRMIVEDCDISYIGGSHLYTRNNRPTRYGNGIEWWCEADDCIVRRCRFWEIYDVALSPQGNMPEKTTQNILVCDNVIWNCEQSFEYWRTGEGAVTKNVVFEHNTCIDAGFGWSHRQRPDKRGTHFLSYTVTAKTDVVLRNNIFCIAKDDGISMFSDWKDGVKLYNNLWYQPPGECFLNYVPTKLKIPASEFEKYQNEFGIEKNSVLAEPKFVDPAARDYRLAPDSPGSALATDGGAVGIRDKRP